MCPLEGKIGSTNVKQEHSAKLLGISFNDKQSIYRYLWLNYFLLNVCLPSLMSMVPANKNDLHFSWHSLWSNEQQMHQALQCNLLLVYAK